MMKKLFILSIIAVFSAGLVGCKDSLDDEIFTAYEEQPIGIFLEQKPEFSEWVKMLRRADLYNALNVNMDFTCFFADNDAVAEYLKLKGYSSVDDPKFTQADVKYLMSYHVIPGVAYQQAALAGKLKDSTASGDFLFLKVREGGVNSIYVNDTALILVKDIETINGYLHQINRVLDPITTSIWEVLEKTADYSIFREAVQACGLQTWLHDRYLVEDEYSMRDYKTAFVISNELFKANQINSLEDLKNRYPGEPTDPEGNFYRFVAYHLINSNSDFADLATFPDDSKTKSKNISTKAELTLIKVEELSSGTTAEEKIVLNPTEDGSIHFVPGKYDIQCMNGYIHEIDGLMEPPFEIVPTTVVFDLCDLDAFHRLDIYKSTTAAEGTYSIDRKTAKDVEWYTVPDNDNAVKYYIRRGQSFCPDGEMFYFNLGYVGWVKVRTPLIAKGTYTMTMYKFAYSDVRGKCQMSIDDRPVGPILDFSGNGKSTQDLGTIEFTENARHWIKFSAIKTGEMDIDRIVFTPVNN